MNKVMIGKVYNQRFDAYEEATFFAKTGKLAVGTDMKQFWLYGTYKNADIKWYPDIEAFRKDGYYFVDAEISSAICHFRQTGHISA